ncbi:MAG: N-acetyltransferase [Planctomycetota bacterium]|nr:MAG: N-acetyltransferase [Planctomycetota bacterium]REK38689.1 MAG: N-acetyltransferase [Planctomycetota bacterium]
MAEVEIQPVSTRAQQKQFLDLPWQLYRDDPLWIPPLRTNQKELVGFKKHPFYERNEVQAFIAVRGCETVGRVAAIVNHGHNERHQEQRGFFGFFESIDDQAVADGLFAAARTWLRERGMETVRGPVNPSLNYECGLLIDGFDESPCFMMTYNPPFYGRLIEGAGFQKCQDLFAYDGHLEMLGQLDEKLAFIGDEAKKRFNIEVRSMDKSRFREEVDRYVELYNRALGGTWGFVPLSPAEMQHMAAALRMLLVPELTCVAEIDGKVVGAVMCLLDYNPRIKAIDGKLFPFGFMRLLWNRKAIKRARAIATTVVPEYQTWGVGLVVLQGLEPKGVAWGLTSCEFSWVLESNKLSRRGLEKGGALLSKTYRLYDFEGR